jgi:hypothetical protein
MRHHPQRFLDDKLETPPDDLVDMYSTKNNRNERIFRGGLNER